MPREKVLRDSDEKTIDVVKEEAEQADITAKAKKVRLVDESGNAINSDNPLPVDTEITVNAEDIIVEKVKIEDISAGTQTNDVKVSQGTASNLKQLAYGQVNGSTYLPIKVATDGGIPALGKLICTIG